MIEQAREFLTSIIYRTVRSIITKLYADVLDDIPFQEQLLSTIAGKKDSVYVSLHKAILLSIVFSVSRLFGSHVCQDIQLLNTQGILLYMISTMVFGLPCKTYSFVCS
ncbi:hypothetical protein F4774DRAFT_381586 [Daldinia eschscholtzii]|nr:hypothetical protein F4774DRAFT_381586 [Daldinia eschscholtzii]